MSPMGKKDCTMRVGDVLEWIAGVCLVVGIFVFAGPGGAFLAGATFLAYEAQCLSATEFTIKLPRPRLPQRLRRRHDAKTTKVVQRT